MTFPPLSYKESSKALPVPFVSWLQVATSKLKQFLKMSREQTQGWPKGSWETYKGRSGEGSRRERRNAGDRGARERVREGANARTQRSMQASGAWVVLWCPPHFCWLQILNFNLISNYWTVSKAKLSKLTYHLKSYHYNGIKKKWGWYLWFILKQKYDYFLFLPWFLPQTIMKQVNTVSKKCLKGDLEEEKYCEMTSQLSPQVWELRPLGGSDAAA